MNQFGLNGFVENYELDGLNSSVVLAKTSALAIGGEITYSTENGITYATHMFKNVGKDIFKPLGYFTAKVLVVGGGGGGGMDMGGGGGGGGVVYTSSYQMKPNENIEVYVGAGGRGAPAGGSTGQGTAHQFQLKAKGGENSRFGNIVAYGGGYGGSSQWTYTPDLGYPGSGASGGGASGYGDTTTATRAGGQCIAGQGNVGGNGYGQYYSGGGGGAGSAGTSATAQPHGGAGICYPDISPYYWGGGGGGAAYSLSTGGNGGIGGGGGGAVGVTTGGAGINNGSGGGGGSPNAQTNTPGGDAGANTGGGGGGGSHYNSKNRGGNGGSGIVIVKYPIKYNPIIIAVEDIVKIPKTGLSLYLDASIPSSYSGTGTTWYDISGNQRNCTWVSSPSYTGGSISYFSALGNRCYGPASNNFGITNSSGYTIILGVRQDSLVASGAFKFYSSNGTSDSADRGIFSHCTWSDDIIYFDQGGCCNADTRTQVASGGITTWSMVTFRSNATNERTIWKNTSKLVTNTTTPASINLNSTAADIIGASAYGGNSSTWNAKVSFFVVYNRAITDIEISDIYNVLKSKIGL